MDSIPRHFLLMRLLGTCSQSSHSLQPDYKCAFSLSLRVLLFYRGSTYQRVYQQAGKQLYRQLCSSATHCDELNPLIGSLNPTTPAAIRRRWGQASGAGFCYFTPPLRAGGLILSAPFPVSEFLSASAKSRYYTPWSKRIPQQLDLISTCRPGAPVHPICPWHHSSTLLSSGPDMPALLSSERR